MYFKYTKLQISVLIVYCVANNLSAFCVSIQAPFYPQLAESKGVTPSQYGIVFGVFSLTTLIFCPIHGKLIPIIGPTVLANLGLLLMGITSILFGFVNKINGAASFFTLSIAIRIVEGIGYSAFRNAAVSVIANEFSENMGTAISFFQASFGTGVIVGPTIGGFLYESGGFTLPFLIIGTLLLLVSFISICFPINSKYEVEETNNFTNGILDLLRQPTIILGCLALFSSHLDIGLLTAILEPHVRQELNFSPSQVGYLFVCCGISYFISAIIWGKICDKILLPQYAWSIGAILIIVGLSLIGPAPYFKYELNIYSLVAGLIIHAMGEAAEIVAGFSGVNKSAISAGFPKNIRTFGLISTLYSSSLSLGICLGPIMGGFLFEWIGFPWETHVYALLHFLIAVATVFYVTCGGEKEKYSRMSSQDELKELHPHPELHTVNYESTENSK